MTSRRLFVANLAKTTGAVVLLPHVVACSPSTEATTPTTPDPEPTPAPAEPTAGGEAEALALPDAKPDDWDAIAFNRARGHAGAIPESYFEAIDGPDGDLAHIGKHLPYLVDAVAPEGMLAVMFGDATQGRARHPAAPGHFFDWVRVAKAEPGASEVEARFSSWPTTSEGDTGSYESFEGAITDDGGKNTVYVVPLPPGVGPGDTVRVVGHCTLHGEYVDFLTV